MSRRKNKKVRLATPKQLLEAHAEFLRSLFNKKSGESDLARALIGASFLDQQVALLLKAHLIEGRLSNDLLNERGLLSSFYNRVRMARCLGLIDHESFNNLCVVGRIRNCFGHSPLPIDFTDDEVARQCNRLRLPNTLLSLGSESLKKVRASPKAKFACVVWELCRLLNQKILEEMSRKVEPTTQK